MRAKSLIATALVIFGIIFTGSSVVCKEWLQDQVFYELLYHETKQLGDYALNGIKVVNIGWWGGVEDAQITFKVNSPNRSIDYPKHEIYIEYLNKPASIKILDGNDFCLDFDNKEYQPDVAIVTNEYDVEIKEPKADGSGGYTIEVTCSELHARSSIFVAIFWFNKKVSKKLNPEVIVGDRHCKPLRDRSFANRYHLIPLSLFSIGALLSGIAIGLWLPHEKTKEIFSYSKGREAEAVTREFLESLLKKINSQ